MSYGDLLLPLPNTSTNLFVSGINQYKPAPVALTWVPTATAGVTTSGTSSAIAVTLSTTALVSGACSNTLTVTNPAINTVFPLPGVSPAPATFTLVSNIKCNVTSYSGYTTGSTTPAPTVVVQSQTTGSCILRLINLGSADMGATDTLTINMEIA